MKSFDMKRFGLLAKWSFRMNAQGLLTSTAGFTFGMLILMMICMYVRKVIVFDDTTGDMVRDIRLNSVISSCLAVLTCTFAICGSWIFGNMKSKQERVMYMMLPASDLEKYLIRYVGVTLGFVVCWFVAFCIADLIRMFMSVFIDRSFAVPLVPMMFRNLYREFSEMEAQDLAFIIMALIWAHSFYLLGGVQFRRRQFIFTSCMFLVIVIVFFKVAESLKESGLMQDEANLDTLSAICCVAFALFTILNYWLSFRLFRHMQVINNKWINV